MAPADYLVKQFGPRSGPTESKLFDTLVVLLKDIFEKVDSKENQHATKKNMQNYPACNLIKMIVPVFLIQRFRGLNKTNLQAHAILILIALASRQ